MFVILFRFLWRLLVFISAISLAYGTAFIAFPYLDKRIAILPVLVILYLGLAYIGIPLLVRFWRVAIKPNHIPLYATTADGWPSDPINIVIVTKSRRHFIKEMKRAGWSLADKITVKNTIKMAYAVIFNTSYPKAIFSSLYLFGRHQDLGFQIQEGTPPTPRHRHHVRFWQLRETAVLKGPHLEHHGFWNNVLARYLSREKQVWIGAATHDIAPFAIRWRNGQITHKIDTQTNKERDYIINTLKSTGILKSMTEVDAGDPLQFRGQTIGVNIVVDGYVQVIELKKNRFISVLKTKQ